MVTLLRGLRIPFEIDGGMAAEAYGSTRELADIDINVPEEDFYKIVPYVKRNLRFGPAWYRDARWELLMMTIKYAGQNIDVGALGQIRYFDAAAEQWIDFPDDLSDVREMDWMDMKLPFVNEMKLMIYKQQLDRGVDRKDVRAMIDHLEESEKL
jgi:hypothetical protein